MYPTLASSSPLLANAFLYICSTPQKQPAAIVAFCDPAGIFTAREAIVLVVENGRRMRERNDMDA
jgi:hypothetical protein